MLATSDAFTPAALKASENEKKIIPNDITKRGWRTKAAVGVKNEFHHCRARPPSPVAWPAGVAVLSRALEIPLVEARMLCNRCAGGSTSASDFSHCWPARASAISGPQTAQTLAWASKLSLLAPLSWPSMASLSRASNWLHSIPCLVSPGITSPSYMYVEVRSQVPPAPG